MNRLHDVSKAKTHLGAWEKDVAHFSELRQWYEHDPPKRSDFQKRYQRLRCATATNTKKLKRAKGAKPIRRERAFKRKRHRSNRVRSATTAQSHREMSEAPGRDR